MSSFSLQFPTSQIQHWAARYSYPAGDALPARIGEVARANGYLSREQLIQLAGWKSARPAKKHAQNDEQTVIEITRLAFSIHDERIRLGALTLLHGVHARTASAILHFCHRDPYPLMDMRAFAALGVVEAPYDWSSLWLPYTAACREIASSSGVSMRTLDRALWAWSAAHGVVAKP